MIYDMVHVNVNCTDLARSLAFYEKLGFRVMHVFGDGVDRLDPDGDPLAGRREAASGHTRGVVLTLGDHPRCFTKLELLEHVEPRTEPQAPRALHEVGLCRIALRCKDLDGEIERLRAAGIEFETEVRSTDSVGAARYAFFRDPDGVMLELIELSAQAPSASASR